VTDAVLGAREAAEAPVARRSIATRPRRAKSKLASSFRTPWWHRAAERMIAVFALAAIAAIALIFVFIAREAIPMFWEVEFSEEVQLQDLFAAKQWRGYEEPVLVWQPVGEPAKFNVIPLFVGSLKVTLLAMLMSVPLGIGCAMFVALYAPRAVREVVKPVIELLAGIPSVVLGFFALMVLASWAQATFGFRFRLNAVVAAIGLALTIVPVIFTIAEDAIQSVPKTLTEAALALGARKYQVALRVVLPAAIPGIAAGVVLGFGRAIGETMIVLMASGNAAVVELFDFSTSVRTITATIAAELGEVAQGDAHWRVLFLLGVMLFAVTFVLNIVGDLAIQRLQKKLTATS
jgi:phosphate transport system permease protein